MRGSNTTAGAGGNTRVYQVQGVHSDEDEEEYSERDEDDEEDDEEAMEDEDHGLYRLGSGS